MKAMRISGYGAVGDVLHMAEIPVPSIKADEVLIEVHATSMNPIDYKTITGALEVRSLLSPSFPFTVGIDFSGTVSKVGSSVARFKPGDEVFAKMPETAGAFAEYVAAKESWLAPKPATISHEQAAALPLVALTTWQALVQVAGLKKGQKVFIPAGSGGIGTFAIQLAKQLGATVATTTSGGNTQLVKSLGADVVIDYKSRDFREVLKDYDVVYDTLGGKTLSDSLFILKRGGIAVTIVGVPDAEFVRTSGIKWYFRPILYALNTKTRRLCGKLGVRYKFVLARSIGEELAGISKLVDAGRIKPVIDRIFPFEKTKDAVLYLQRGRAKGKVIAKIK